MLMLVYPEYTHIIIGMYFSWVIGLEEGPVAYFVPDKDECFKALPSDIQRTAFRRVGHSPIVCEIMEVEIDAELALSLIYARENRDEKAVERIVKEQIVETTKDSSGTQIHHMRRPGTLKMRETDRVGGIELNPDPNTPQSAVFYERPKIRVGTQV